MAGPSYSLHARMERLEKALFDAGLRVFDATQEADYISFQVVPDRGGRWLRLYRDGRITTYLWKEALDSIEEESVGKFNGSNWTEAAVYAIRAVHRSRAPERPHWKPFPDEENVWVSRNGEFQIYPADGPVRSFSIWNREGRRLVAFNYQDGKRRSMQVSTCLLMAHLGVPAGVTRAAQFVDGDATHCVLENLRLPVGPRSVARKKVQARLEGQKPQPEPRVRKSRIPPRPEPEISTRPVRPVRPGVLRRTETIQRDILELLAVNQGELAQSNIARKVDLLEGSRRLSAKNRNGRTAHYLGGMVELGLLAGRVSASNRYTYALTKQGWVAVGLKPPENAPEGVHTSALLPRTEAEEKAFQFIRVNKTVTSRALAKYLDGNSLMPATDRASKILRSLMQQGKIALDYGENRHRGIWRLKEGPA